MAPADGRQNSTAAADLARLGYKSDLPRSLSMLSILGLSFAIMAVPFGTSTLMATGLTDGGPVTIIWGWVFVSLISLSIAASLAEICAVYPTAGGVYYWSAMMSTRKWAPIASWVTGWFNLVGNWTVTLSINFSGAQLILSAIGLWNPDYSPAAWQTVLMFWAVTIICFLVNAFGSRYLDLFNKICIYFTAAGVLIILVTLLVKAPSRHTGAFAFGHFDASSSGWPDGWAFFVGLLQAAYTLTGYGLVASLCEEVNYPEREVPKAMVLSVAAAGITGVIYLVPICFVLPDNISDLLATPTGQPIGLLFKEVTGTPGGGFGLLFIILGIWFFAGVGSLTAASRCTWSFARDGGLPGRCWLGSTSAKLEIPFWGLVLSTVVDMLLGLIYFGSTAAFNSFTGVATIALSCGYGFPILVSLLRGREPVKHSTFSLGKFGFAINVICLCWISLAIVLFCMPVSIPVTPSTMTYTSVVFMG